MTTPRDHGALLMQSQNFRALQFTFSIGMNILNGKCFATEAFKGEYELGVSLQGGWYLLPLEQQSYFTGKMQKRVQRSCKKEGNKCSTKLNFCPASQRSKSFAL